MYKCKYYFLEFEILLISDGKYLTNLYIKGQAGYFDVSCDDELEIFDLTKKWLDIYFSGNIPDFSIPIRLEGTDFQKEVWKYLLEIPYGEVVTYGDIARKIAINRGISKMNSRAVGHAIGKNPISIIVPCHRVVGKNNSLTGYNGGIDKKKRLLEIEGISV